MIGVAHPAAKAEFRVSWLFLLFAGLERTQPTLVLNLLSFPHVFGVIALRDHIPSHAWKQPGADKLKNKAAAGFRSWGVLLRCISRKALIWQSFISKKMTTRPMGTAMRLSV
jgi:hypothetical protein